MDTSRLRTLPFGTGVLLLRSAPPIVLDLQPWTARRDAAALAAGRAEVEARPQARRQHSLNRRRPARPYTRPAQPFERKPHAHDTATGSRPPRIPGTPIPSRSRAA